MSLSLASYYFINLLISTKPYLIPARKRKTGSFFPVFPSNIDISLKFGSKIAIIRFFLV